MVSLGQCLITILLYRSGTNVIKYFEVYKQKVYPTPISDFIRKGNTLIRSCFTIIEHYWNFSDIGLSISIFFLSAEFQNIRVT